LPDWSVGQVHFVTNKGYDRAPAGVQEMFIIVKFNDVSRCPVDRMHQDNQVSVTDQSHYLGRFVFDQDI
jgi:hypothetical protein